MSGNDLLEYWESDPRTHVILLYLESFGNPRRFARLARRISRTKPIVAVKAGRTGAGSRAAGSHTAALAASDTAVDALFHQSGVIRADTIDEMFDIATCLDAQPLPTGGRVGVVTNAGGPGILAVDACVAAGLTVNEFSTATRARLAAFLPATASVGNPVDMVASAGPDQYRRTIEAVATSDDIDALLVIFTPVDASRSEEILTAIRDGIRDARATGHDPKPILACVMTDGRPPVPLRRRCRDGAHVRVPGERRAGAGKNRRLRGLACSATRPGLGIRRYPRRRGTEHLPARPRRAWRRMADGRRDPCRAARVRAAAGRRCRHADGRRGRDAGRGARLPGGGEAGVAPRRAQERSSAPCA